MIEDTIILRVLGVSRRAINSKMRLAKIVEARKIISYVLNEKGYRKDEIAVYAGYDAINSVSSAINSLKNEMKVDRKYQEKINRILKQVNIN